MSAAMAQKKEGLNGMSENEKLEQAAEKAAPAPEKPVKVDKKKDAKAEKKSKPGFFARLGKWFKEMKSELKKVQWPTRQQTINNTLIVIACVIVVGVFIWIFDYIAGSAIDVLLTLLR